MDARPCDTPDEGERFTIIPAVAGGWGSVASALARKVASLPDRNRWWYLILEAEMCGSPYVQLATSPDVILTEVRSDLVWFHGPRLAGRVIDAMVLEDWQRPVGSCIAPNEWKPNWWREWLAPFDLQALCGELVHWLVAGFALDEQVPTTLFVFPGSELDDGVPVAAPEPR